MKTLIVPEEGWFGQPKYSTSLKSNLRCIGSCLKYLFAFGSLYQRSDKFLENITFIETTGSLIRTMLVPFPFLVHKSLRVEKSTTHARQGTLYNNAPKEIQEGNKRFKFDSGTALSQH